MDALEYGDIRLPGWSWADIYPCPVTGCWLHVARDVPITATICGQAACCNPAHVAEIVAIAG